MTHCVGRQGGNATLQVHCTLSLSLSERCVGDEKGGLFIKVLKMNAFSRDVSKKHYCCQLTLLPSLFGVGGLFTACFCVSVTDQDLCVWCVF